MVYFSLVIFASPRPNLIVQKNMGVELFIVDKKHSVTAPHNPPDAPRCHSFRFSWIICGEPMDMYSLGSVWVFAQLRQQR